MNTRGKRATGSLVICILVLVAPALVMAQSLLTIRVNCNRGQSVQSALNLLFVPATLVVTGTCNENIVIPENINGITLDGQGTAIIKGPDQSKNTVEIIGREIKIRGFTITGGLDGIGVVRGGTARIEKNIIQYTGRHGIGIVKNSYAEILDSTIQNNPNNGILIKETSSVRVGFTLYSIPDPHPNFIMNNGYNGIQVRFTSNADIVGNTISNNGMDGVGVDRGSHANISYNTINGNQRHGVLVYQNSSVNLGEDKGTRIFDLPNSTTDNNASRGIRCSIGGYVDGRLGSLNGNNGAIFADFSCIDSTIP